MDDLRTHYNREIHENNTSRAGVKAIWTGASNSRNESSLAVELPNNVSPISLSPDRSLSPISLEEGDEVLPTTTTSTSKEVISTTNKHLNGRQPVIQNIVRKNDRQSSQSSQSTVRDV